MRPLLFVFALCLSAVVGGPSQRIVGGSQATIGNYPFAVAVLRSNSLACGGVILNNRSVLSAGRCMYQSAANDWNLRVGSAYSNSGGSVYNVDTLIIHPQFEYWYKSNDVGIYRIPSTFPFGGNIQPGSFAGANYIVNDNQAVWTYGWGASSTDGPFSTQLQHVQIQTVNQDVCKSNYNIIAMTVTDNMICAGNLDQGGQGPCNGDFGGPLLHNGNVIGIFSWDSAACGFKGYPAIFTRVPKYIDWISNNA